MRPQPRRPIWSMIERGWNDTMPRWLIYTLLTMLLWGGWGVVSKPLSTGVSWGQGQTVSTDQGGGGTPPYRAALSCWEVQSLSMLGLLPVIAVVGRSKNLRSGARS